MKQIKLTARYFLIPVFALGMLTLFITLTLDLIFRENSAEFTPTIFYATIGFFIFIQILDSVMNFIISNHVKIIDIVLTIPIYIISFIVLYTAGPVALLITNIKPKSVYRVGNILCTIQLFFLGVRYKIFGTLPRNGQFVVVANHTSVIDELLIALLMGIKEWTIVFAHEIKRIPFLGKMLKKNGISVDRNDRLSKAAAAEKAMEEVKNGKNYAAYPEGKRLRVEDFEEKGIVLYDFKLSAFNIACELSIPVYPVVFAFPYYYKPRSGKWWVSPRRIKIIILDPVYTDNKTPQEVAKEVHDLMEERLRYELGM